jgi:hypothetical protein
MNETNSICKNTLQSDSINEETCTHETKQFNLVAYDQINEKPSTSNSTLEHMKLVMKDWRHYESDVETCDTEDDLEEDYSVNFLSSVNQDNIPPSKLCGLRRVERKVESWRRLAIADFCKVPDFFDALDFDVKVERYTRSDLILELRPMSTLIGQFRQDPRSSAVTLIWKPYLTKSETLAVSTLVKEKRPVYRVTYLCHGYSEWNLGPKKYESSHKNPNMKPKIVPLKLAKRMTASQFMAYHQCQHTDTGNRPGSNVKGNTIAMSQKGRARKTCPVLIHLEVSGIFTYDQT